MEIRLLIVGDSLTNATTYANEVGRLLSLPGNPRWTMSEPTGRRKRLPAWATKATAAGLGSCSRPSTNPIPIPAKRLRGSPFVYPSGSGKPVLDLNRYFVEHCSGERPDFVTFMLGINDCFGANPEDPAAIDARIDAVMVHADTLLNAFRKAAPQAELGICLTTPPNARSRDSRRTIKASTTVGVGSGSSIDWSSASSSDSQTASKSGCSSCPRS